MPTTKPRYTITDTGEMASMLDEAQRRWPDVHDRRLLLVRLAEAGRDAIVAEAAIADGERRRERQQEALGRATGLVDVDELLSDAAWR